MIYNLTYRQASIVKRQSSVVRKCLTSHVSRLTIFFFISTFLVFHSASAQDSLFKISITIKGDFENFTVDNLGNYFLLDKQNQLKKVAANGDSVGVFNNVRQYGKLYYIDATNPLKILLYYKDYNTIVVLDRFLNLLNVIDLRKAGIFQVRAIAQSYDNNVWVFDELESKLKRIGDDGSVIFESTDLRMVFDSTPQPVRIVDRDNFVYLYDPAQGFFVFDYYGGLKNKLPFLQLRDVQVIEKIIMGRRGNKLTMYETGSLNLREYDLPGEFKGADKIKINSNAIYALKEDGIKCYLIK